MKYFLETRHWQLSPMPAPPCGTSPMPGIPPGVRLIPPGVEPPCPGLELGDGV